MRPLTPAEARDLARVVSHKHFVEMTNYGDGEWLIVIRQPSEALVEFYRRTLRAALKAAVRWIEEEEHA